MDHNGTKRPGFELGVHFHWASRRWCILILWTLTTAVAGFQELAKYSMARSIIGKIQPAPTLNSSICSLLATFKRCHGSWMTFAFDGSWMGQRFLELNTAFSSTWANGLRQRKEATEVAFLAAVNERGIKIGSLLASAISPHMLTKPFTRVNCDNSAAQANIFDHLPPWWILNPICFEELPFRHLFAVFLLSSEALCSTFFLLILAWTYRFDYRFLVELSDWVFNLLCSWARLLCWVVM